MRRFCCFVALLAAVGCGARPQATVSGETKLWHTVTLSFKGPETSETADPNPFTDYRLDVAFAGPSGKTYRVPGFYAADGDAAESGADAGSVWQVRFTPDAEGEWRYTAQFRTGPGVIYDDDADPGEPTGFDGATGTFVVGPSDKSGRDFRAHGRLEYVGERYPRFAGSGEYFLKGGADSPENLLAYVDFDATRRRAEVDPAKAMQPILHAYEPHVADWREGDPKWRDGRGKGLIGGLNYLASRGVNSIYFLVMNVTGDGDDVWPWIDPDVRDRYDVSKLDQWEIVFQHADRLGILLHVVTAETENDHLLDEGGVGPERMLYYRELVARFAHHPALLWNLGEENTNSDEQRRAQARRLHELDPYDHPVVMHTHSRPEAHHKHYRPLIGYEWFEGASMQIRDDELVHDIVIEWIARSVRGGRPWLVAFDEQRLGSNGVAPDHLDPDRSDERRDHLWATLMAGGWGIEWYFGYEYPHNDVNLEDWRTRETLWRQTEVALGFFRAHLPFWEMQAADELTAEEDNFVFAKPGEVYAVYVPTGGTVTLDLSEAEGDFEVSWFDPREGGELRRGSVERVEGGAARSLGTAPGESGLDWVALVRRGE